MKSASKYGMAFLCAVLLFVMPGCHSSDDTTQVPVNQVVQGSLDNTLNTTVVPVVTFMRAVTGLLTGARAVAGVSCPDTSAWCTTGTAVCSVGTSGLDFQFNQCQAVSGDTPLTLNGVVTAVPSVPTALLTLTNLSINGTAAVSGTGTINLTACTYAINIHTSDTTIAGTIVKCDADAYPTGQTLVISFSDIVVTIALDGSATAHATAVQSGAPVATCTIDLSANPLTSTCAAY